MGNSCFKSNKANSDLDQLNDEKKKRDYYLNIKDDNAFVDEDVGQSNFDIVENKPVGYAHI